MKVEPPTDAEIDNAEAAFQEHERTGGTARTCMRCGGALRFQDAGSAYRIRCERGDFVLTSRGL